MGSRCDHLFNLALNSWSVCRRCGRIEVGVPRQPRGWPRVDERYHCKDVRGRSVRITVNINDQSVGTPEGRDLLTVREGLINALLDGTIIEMPLEKSGPTRLLVDRLELPDGA